MPILLGIWCALACVIWGYSVYQFVRFHREWWDGQTGRSFWFKFWNSNAAIFSETLSPQGVSRRRRAIISLLCFIGAVFVGMLLFAIAGRTA